MTFKYGRNHIHFRNMTLQGRPRDNTALKKNNVSKIQEKCKNAVKSARIM
jgi:hypothetical protein